MSKKPSLVAQSEEVSNEPTFPVAEYGQFDGANIDDGGEVYVGFGPEKGDKVEEFRSMGIESGDPYIRHGDGIIEKLKPLRVHLMDAFGAYVETNGQYEPVAATLEKPAERGSKFKEHIEALVLAHTSRGIIPARMTFRTTKTPAVKSMVKEARSAAEPSWIERSSAHRAAAQIPYIWGRYTGVISVMRRTSKSSGYIYFEAKATCQPTTEQEEKAINTFFSDVKNKATLDTVRSAYLAKVEEIKKLLD